MSRADYSRLVSDAAGLALGLEDAINQTDAHVVPELIASQVPELEAVTLRLKQVECPSEVEAAHRTLIGGLETFADDLVHVSEEASLAASQGDVYQRGFFSSSLSWTDNGARMRWELSLSHGLIAIKQALRELHTAGLTDSGGTPADGFASAAAPPPSDIW